MFGMFLCFQLNRTRRWHTFGKVYDEKIVGNVIDYDLILSVLI